MQATMISRLPSPKKVILVQAAGAWGDGDETQNHTLLCYPRLYIHTGQDPLEESRDYNAGKLNLLSL